MCKLINFVYTYSPTLVDILLKLWESIIIYMLIPDLSDPRSYSNN